MKSLMTVIAYRLKVAHFLAASGRISEMMNLNSKFFVASLANATSAMNHFKTQVAPPIPFFVGGFELEHEVFLERSKIAAWSVLIAICELCNLYGVIRAARNTRICLEFELMPANDNEKQMEIGLEKILSRSNRV